MVSAAGRKDACRLRDGREKIPNTIRTGAIQSTKMKRYSSRGSPILFDKTLDHSSGSPNTHVRARSHGHTQVHTLC